MSEYNVLFVDLAENVRIEKIIAVNKSAAIDKVRNINGVIDIIHISQPHVW